MTVTFEEMSKIRESFLPTMMKIMWSKTWFVISTYYKYI